MPDFPASNTAEAATSSRGYLAGENNLWAARFGRIVAHDGVAAIPQALFYYQGPLGLAAQEVWFIASIFAESWDGDLPHGSQAELARRSTLTLSQVRRIRQGLEQKRYLKTIPRHGTASAGQLTNCYDFSALFEQLERLVAADPRPANEILDDGAPTSLSSTQLAGDWSFVARYGRLLVSNGVATIPRALFRYQGELKLTPQQVWFCCYVLAHKWGADLPYPSLRKMEERTGYSRRQLQVIKDELVSAGYLRCVKRTDAGSRQTSDGYDFGALLLALGRYVEGGSERTAATAAVIAEDGLELVAPRRRGRRSAVREILPLLAARQNGDSGAMTPLAYSSPSPLAYSSPSPLAHSSPSPSHGIHHPLAPDSPSPLAHSSPSPLACSSPESDAKESDSKKNISNHAATQKKAGNDAMTPPYSPWIAAMIVDFSRELGDGAHMQANVTQTLCLWQRSGIREGRLVELLNQARATTREYQGKQGTASIANRMAYLFRVLEDLLARDVVAPAAEVTAR